MSTHTTLLAAALFIPLGLALLTFAFFWYETANGPHRLHLERVSRGRVAWWMARGVLCGWGSITLTLLFFPFALWRSLWKPKPGDSSPAPPVILVHGLYHNASAWLLYRWWLKKAGLADVYAFGYSSFKHSFPELCEQLGRFVSEVSRQSGGRPVLLIGHSLGGLLCRAYVDGPEGGRDVAAVVALGAPHQGSKLAALGLGRLARSLAYRGALAQEMEQLSAASPVPRLALYSPLDNMVLPNEALQVPYSGWEHREARPVSHVGMLYHRPTAKLVIDFLIKGIAAPAEK